MRESFHTLALIVICLVTLSSCNLFHKNTKKIDVSAIEVDIEINRFEEDFFQVDTNNLFEDLNALRSKDSLFFDFYAENVMRFGKISDSLTPTMLDLHHFFTNPYVLDLYDTVAYKFPNLDALDQELTLALKHYKYYYPSAELPKFRTIISEFGYNVVALDDEFILIALDMYLGKNYKYYGSFDFPTYIINRFEPEYIVPNSIEVLFNGIYEPENISDTEALIHAMIEKGKKLYFLECMQPQKERHFLIGYTKEELLWCEGSEGDIWKFYNEHDLFYSKSYMEHSRHIGDGPTTAGMPAGAPGNVGSWVGWQIVNQYVENTEVKPSLQELLAMKPETILAKSNYKPK